MKTTLWTIASLGLALALVACDDTKTSPETKQAGATPKQDAARGDTTSTSEKAAKSNDEKVEPAAKNDALDKDVLEGKKSKLKQAELVSHDLVKPAASTTIEDSTITVAIGDEEPRTFTFIEKSSWNWSYEPGNFILTYMSIEKPKVGEIFGMRIHLRSDQDRVQLGKELSNSPAALSLTLKRSDGLGMDNYESTLGEIWYALDPQTGKLSATFETQTRYQPTYKPPLVDDKNLFKTIRVKGSFALSPKVP